MGPARSGARVSPFAVRIILWLLNPVRMTKFRHKALAALLASLTGALGLNRLYLGQKLWWLPLAVTWRHCRC